MAMFTSYSEAEAKHRGINIKGLRRFLNLRTYQGKRGVAFTVYIGTIGFVYSIIMYKSKPARDAQKALAAQNYQDFLGEAKRWKEGGRVFTVDDLKKL